MVSAAKAPRRRPPQLGAEGDGEDSGEQNRVDPAGALVDRARQVCASSLRQSAGHYHLAESNEDQDGTAEDEDVGACQIRDGGKDLPRAQQESDQ